MTLKVVHVLSRIFFFIVSRFCDSTHNISIMQLTHFHFSFSLYRMSQDRPSSRDGSSKILNHVLMQASPNIQFNNNINNNNNLIINKNTFVAIETGSVVGSGNKSNSNNILVHHNKSSGSCNTMTTASVPSPSVNYISKETINCV